MNWFTLRNPLFAALLILSAIAFVSNLARKVEQRTIETYCPAGRV